MGLENTLIKRITIQKMGDRGCLSLQSVVWGKVGAFPWWPGKIVQQLRQQHHCVYKVSFFGDASYSFLLPEHILPHQDFDFQLNASFDHDLKLQNAVRLAHAALSRKRPSCKSTDHDSNSPELPTPPSHQLEQQPISPLEHTAISFVEPDDLFAREITSENVVELIELVGRSRRVSKCYASRKEVNQFKQKLTHRLLAKYNLHSLDELTLNKHKLIVKSAKTNGMDAQIQRIQAIKKIQRRLHALGTNLNESKSRAIELYQAMQLKSAKGGQKMEAIYVRMLSYLNSSLAESTEDIMALCEEGLRE